MKQSVTMAQTFSFFSPPMVVAENFFVFDGGDG
jgi:hypothetical protein